MPIDSTADLLFRISANADDAQNNVARFRALLGKDLASISGDFEGWAAKVFGSVNTWSGAATAGAAAIGAGLAAVVGYAVHAGNAYHQYAEEIAMGSRKTQISTEVMSGLHFAAVQTGTSFDTLTRGVVFFEKLVVNANASTEAYQKTFGRLGISQKQMADGEKNILPLLGSVMDAYKGLGANTERAAIARDMFSRGGAELQGFLSLGSEGLKRMSDRAREMGLILSGEDIVALHKFNAELATQKALQQAIDVQIGRVTLPLLTELRTRYMAVWMGMSAAAKDDNFFQFYAHFAQYVVSSSGTMADKIHAAYKQIKEDAAAMAKALEHLGEGKLGPPPPEKLKEGYEGLSNVLETVRGRLAATEGAEAKAAQEITHLVFETGKALDALKKQNAEGKLEPEVFERELKAWEEIARQLPALQGELFRKIAAERADTETKATAGILGRIRSEVEQTQEIREQAWNAEIDEMVREYSKGEHIEQAHLDLLANLRAAGLAKIRAEAKAADDQATADLQQRLAARQEKTLESEVAGWNAEMAKLREDYSKKRRLTEENEAIIAAIQHAGLDKIYTDAQAAFDRDLARLQEEAQKIRASHQTSQERVVAQYEADVAKFSAAEEKKALTTARSEQQRTAIVAAYAAIRAALLGKEQADLQALQNSVGWKGVFGNEFAQMIRRDEALSKEWATSVNQSHMMVRASLEGLREVGMQSFDGLARGMGSNIASAAVYKKSIGEAMRAAAASTLESLAAESLTYAIYSTALGFLRLAQHDYEGAGQAFTSAAIWGSVGAAAAVAGRAIAPSQAGAAGAGAGSAGVGGGTAAGAAGGAGNAAGAGAGGPHVTVNVWGHIMGVSGVQEFASMLNDAVLNKDVTLTATNTKNGVQVTR